MKTEERPPHNGSPNSVIRSERDVMIRDVIVADPSIAFSLILNALDFKKSPDGYYLRDLEIQVLLNNLYPEFPDRFVSVAKIFISSVSQLQLYFDMPFGDPNYNPGDEFTLKLILAALDPVSGEPVTFNEGNVYTLDVFGGGVPGQ